MTLEGLRAGRCQHGAYVGQSNFRCRDCEIDALKARLAEARRVCDEQANDEGLWFVAETVTEAYLQSALRRLHAAVETGGLTIRPDYLTIDSAQK